MIETIRVQEYVYRAGPSTSIVDNDEDTSSFHAFAVLFVAVNPRHMMMDNNHRMTASLFEDKKGLRRIEKN
uniref:Uncharacterized protein n=1 Tax=Strigamia maritima TaxID=126957 RepID=T1J154_STRMM